MTTKPLAKGTLTTVVSIGWGSVEGDNCKYMKINFGLIIFKKYMKIHVKNKIHFHALKEDGYSGNHERAGGGLQKRENILKSGDR